MDGQRRGRIISPWTESRRATDHGDGPDQHHAKSKRSIPRGCNLLTGTETDRVPDPAKAVVKVGDLNHQVDDRTLRGEVNGKGEKLRPAGGCGCADCSGWKGRKNGVDQPPSPAGGRWRSRPAEAIGHSTQRRSMRRELGGRRWVTPLSLRLAPGVPPNRRPSSRPAGRAPHLKTNRRRDQGGLLMQSTLRKPGGR